MVCITNRAYESTGVVVNTTASAGISSTTPYGLVLVNRILLARRFVSAVSYSHYSSTVSAFNSVHSAERLHSMPPSYAYIYDAYGIQILRVRALYGK